MSNVVHLIPRTRALVPTNLGMGRGYWMAKAKAHFLLNPADLVVTFTEQVGPPRPHPRWADATIIPSKTHEVWRWEVGFDTEVHYRRLDEHRDWHDESLVIPGHRV